MAYETSNNIDVDRLLADLRVSEADLQQVASLDIPKDVRVPSGSVIKTGTVEDVLRIINPSVNFEVLGVKTSSGVAEQPLGQAAVDGAINRLRNGMQIREQIVPGESENASWFSIENGLFRVKRLGMSTTAKETDEGIVQLTEDADLLADFDPEAEYEDRAVTVIHIPGYPTVAQVSPHSEAVTFPRVAVRAAYNAEGGFDQHTVGSKLAEMGIVKDKQNPHSELTVDRRGGPLPRQDQMARVMLRVLVQLAQH
jgi:hypothetical protein